MSQINSMFIKLQTNTDSYLTLKQSNIIGFSYAKPREMYAVRSNIFISCTLREVKVFVVKFFREVTISMNWSIDIQTLHKHWRFDKLIYLGR